MAPPASKRRKTDHVSSSEEDEDAAFASFSDDASEGAHDVQQLHGEDSDEDEEINDAEEEAEEGGEENDASGNDFEGEGERKAAIATSKPPPATNDTRRKPDRAAQVGASVYAQGSYKSNVFKLQVDELLTQIRPKQGQREVNAEAALHKLKKTIEHIPNRGPFLLQDAERDLIKEKVAIPFPEPRPPIHAKYKFAYTKPAMVNIVGSFALKTSLRSRDQLEVDMIAVMPSSLFEEKDYLNYRYFYKRAYYLACIAAGFKKAHKAEYQIHFKLMHNDPLKPVLVVSSAEQDTPANKWSVNIIPCVGQSQFASEKLRLDRNCVRGGDKDEAESHLPTPFYNSSLRSDMLMMDYLKLLHAASKRCEAFKDACLLGSTWLRQRSFASTTDAGGFGDFEWNAFMALCLQTGGPNNRPLLSDGYSSYQLFKAMLQILGMRDFTKSPLGIQSSPKMAKSVVGPVVWDAERDHNLLYRVSEWSYRLLRAAARATITTLGDQMYDGFDATFILRITEPLYSSDYVFQVAERLLHGEQLPDHESQQHLQSLYSVLRKGLGDRVTRISISNGAVGSWNLGSSRPKAASKGLVSIGLVVNPDNVKRTVDHGPSAEQKSESADFRKFWGGKAELRRFKDGSILESLVWTPPQESGYSVLEQVVRFLLGHHFGAVTLDDVKFVGDDFSKLVKSGSDIKPFEPLMARYKQFENDIRDLHDLPLSIRQIMPASSQLCYSSIRPPPNGKAKSVPADVTIQFEGSGRWPDDLVAIQRTKIAFLLKINDMLSESVDTITTRIGLESEGQDALNQGFLDVTYDQDATFRLRIYHDREQTLLERQLKNKSTDPKTREIAAIGLARYKREYLKSPAQTQANTRLCTRFPALSGAIRLTKKWFASHLLSNHIAEEIIELLVIQTFTHPSPWQTPSSVQTAFLRTLFWISRWDWRADPLIVDLSGSGDLKPADLQIIRTNFEAWRKLDPAMNRVALFAASNLDHEGTTWTDGQPAKVVAGRMTSLAKAAVAEIKEKGIEIEPASLFSSSLGDFDFVVHLNSTFVDGKSRRKSGASQFKNLELDTITDTDLIGLDPIKEFLKDLEDVYGSAILFFHGGSERAVIAGLWSPLTTERRGWKVNLAYSTLPAKSVDQDGDVLAALNKSGVLAEISRLGGDLVEKIEVVEH